MIGDLFLNAAILISFISIGNLFLKDKETNLQSSVKYKIFYGIFTGILGCILIIYSVRVYRDVIIDFRIIAVILASTIGGYTSSIISGIIIGLFRLTYFGISIASIIPCSTAILIGIMSSQISSKCDSLIKKWTYSFLYCNLVISLSFVLLVDSIEYLITVIAYYWAGTTITAIIVFYYISYLLEFNRMYKKYKEESTRDFLTGLNNVRQFEKALNNIAYRLQEREENLSMLFIDIDFFKKVNDTYGHTEGDIILKELASILVKSCRTFDIVSRMGGEEFSIMLLDCPLKQAREIGERIRSSIEKYSFVLSDNRKINITISIGISSYPECTKDLHEILKKADDALYKAKQSGRNRVELCDCL